MTTTESAPLAETLRQVCARIAKELPRADSEAATALAEGFLGFAEAEDLDGETPENLFGLAAAVWDHFRRRAQGTPKVRAYNPNIEEHGWHCRHSVVEVVNDDSPFLLDSTLAALNLLDLTVHLVIHPVLPVRRRDDGRALQVGDAEEARPESIIHVQVTRQTDAADLAAIVQRLEAVYADIRAAVEDWRPMLARVDELVEELRGGALPVAETEVAEGIAFLEWLRDDNFTFLGVRDYQIEVKGEETYLRAEEDQGLGVLRAISAESKGRYSSPVPDHYANYLRRQELFVISKAWSRSKVHRAVYMDYIGVRRFDAEGTVIGERRFLGLLTSTAYSTRPTRIPLLRHKVESLLTESGLARGGHDAKALRNVLENYPRDELFQVDLPFLGRTAREIVRLEHRQRLRLFLRRDGYGNFFSALVFVPRDAYSTGLREQMEAILRQRLNGDSVETATQFSEAPMVRAHFIVRIDDSSGADPDTVAIERELASAARNWNDDFLEVLIEAHGEAEGAHRHRRFARALPDRYKADFAPRAAVADTDRIVPLREAGQLALNLYRPVGADENQLNFKVYRRGSPIPLSSILPMLEHMGFVVLEERSYAVSAEQPEDAVTIHDFRIANRFGTELDVTALRDRFEALFSDIWRGRVASDNFNYLVVHGLDGREVSLIRAYAKYLRQVKAPFSLAYMAETLADHPEITRLLVAQIRALHDPAGEGDPNRRAADLHRQILQELERVASADQDRILRRFLNLINATLRTNFFQRDAEDRPKSAIALKFECNAITALPEPRPWREVFVYSPNFEAVHLRGGRVARGGIRWSDRREDYRTEILGLMKAQSVKNAVIVPVGAKGGFALTRPSPEPDLLRQEAVGCYRTFMGSLLDVTDDLVAGEVVRRAGSVHHDGDDPYLVVAADKGTATFSDEANAVSEGYGYWLGDAFASGGSAGYDHKVMGITARGAWEAVKRHFRESGLDTQSEPFTVVGIGDMSGDVFGNGMLLSEHIRLVGAFNHLHIFVDPDPDAAAGFAERQRLFALPRSSWEDYDQSLLSEGGAIFSRQAKLLTLSPQIREQFGIRAEKIEPNALIRALLTAEVDLLWNGGIGTYVKAQDETHAEVDDRANDALRVNAGDVRARVIGEGGNLGLTQAARVEFARQGGKVNSDAIDNSAGVDCSDHEVNIKILLNGAVASGDLTGKQRDQRLAAMTDEVAAMVLRHNYLQTQCLSMVESFGVRMFEEQARFLRRLESTGRLAEEMPDEEELDRRRAAGEPFTRPELGVLMAYAKIGLFDELVQSRLPDDPYLERELFDYFPEPLRPEFAVRMPEHRLRREIIATRIANSTIERAGLTYIHRHTEHSGILAPAVARAYLQIREIFGLDRLWVEIEKEDYQIPAALQARLHARLMFFVDRMTSWFLRYVPPHSPFSEVVPGYQEGVQAIEAALETVLDAGSRSLRDGDRDALAAAGTPDDLADALARIEPLGAACDIVEVARQTGSTPVAVAAVFFEVGHRYGCGWLRQRAQQLPQTEHWSMLAAQTIAEDSYAHQRTLTARILARAGDAAPGPAAIDAWAKDNEEALRRFGGVFQELQSAMSLDLAMLSLANRALRVLAETAELPPGE